MRRALVAVVVGLLAHASLPARAEEPPADARERWEQLSPEEKELLRERWRAYQGLPHRRKEELAEALRRFRSLRS